MKKLLKSRVFLVIVTALVFGSLGVFASSMLASNVTYGNTTVEGALDTLYTKATTYKNLTTETTAQAGDITSGKTAYDNLGNLITGTLSTNGNCVFGTDTCDSNCETSNGMKIGNYNFNPSAFLIWTYISDSGMHSVEIYSSNISTTYLLSTWFEGNNGTDTRVNISGNFRFNNGLYMQNGYYPSGQEFHYMLCQ